MAKSLGLETTDPASRSDSVTDGLCSLEKFI